MPPDEFGKLISTGEGSKPFNIDLHILLPQALYVDMFFRLDFAKCLVVVVGASFHLRS